jgi:ABC-type branched-subunit amino acid transport system substrate-binding protein
MPIKFGIIYDSENAAVPHPEIPKAAQAAVDFVNANGGVKGAPLEVVTCDAQTNPTVGAECARKMVDSKVTAVVGMYTQTDPQAMPILTDAKIPVIGNISSLGPGLTAANAFPIGSAAIAGPGATARALVDRGAKKIVFAVNDSAGGQAAVEHAKKVVASFTEPVETSTVPVPTATADMASLVQAALNNDPGGVVLILPRDDAINFAQTLRDTNGDVLVGNYGGDVQLIIQRLGNQANGIITVGTYNDGPNTPNPEAGGRFSDAMKKAGASPNEYSANAYGAILVFAKVAAEVPEVSSASLLAKLPTVTGVDPYGFMPPVQFQTPAPQVPDARVFNLCYNTRQVTDGALKSVNNDYVNAFTGTKC